MSEKKRPRQPKQTAWTRKWNESNLDRISVVVPKGLKSRIQAHANENNETVNGMIGRLLRAEMKLSEDWTKKNGEK